MKCIICGKEIPESLYFHKPLCSNKCFNINFWNDCLDESAIIVDGKCYHDAGRKPNGTKWLGFGGSEFTIEMNDGRIIKTNNLWHNGEVPKERNVKDNARFI